MEWRGRRRRRRGRRKEEEGREEITSGMSLLASSCGIGLAPGIRLSGAFAVFITWNDNN